jgi:SnoaL-like protein
MSQERIDAVRRACEAWGAREFESLRDVYTADVTADGGALWLESGSSAEGFDAVIRNFEAIVSMFELNELFAEGAVVQGDTLVVPLMWRGLPVGGTAFVEQRLFGVFTFRGSKIESMTWFTDLQEALTAVGLPPSAAGQMIAIERPVGEHPDRAPHKASPGAP